MILIIASETVGGLQLKLIANYLWRQILLQNTLIGEKMSEIASSAV